MITTQRQLDHDPELSLRKDNLQQQLDLFTDPAEQRRAERLERVARLAASTSTKTAKHLFDAAGERQARRIAGESVPPSPMGSV